MYCIKCGVHLADTEKKCPLCGTTVYHPEIEPTRARELYPSGKMPTSSHGRAYVCGAIIFLFMIPLIVTFLSDMHPNGKLDWFGYAAGGIGLLYLIVALPLWFKKPHPVIFTPCFFAACAVYLLYIDLDTNGGWFLSFAMPVLLGLALVVCALVILLQYLRKGKLYVVGGFLMALGGLVLMVELLMDMTFRLPFTGWSLYPLIALFFLGGMLIYLALNSAARETIERKLFF
jgi:hypothetical protein